MNCGWYEIIEGTAHYYQSNFNMSRILAQLSDYNDILSRHIQARSITGNGIFLSSSSMRATANVCQPENSSVIISTSEEINEEDAQVVAENNKRDTSTKVTTKENEGWIKPMKFAAITHFDAKSNKSNEINTNSNRYDGLSEDDDVENNEYEEALVEQRKEKMIFFLHKVDNKKVKHSKKERKVKKE